MTAAHHSDPTIAVVGLWHLGCVTAAGLAEMGLNVIGIDRDPERIAGLRRGEAPVHEPGLDLQIRAQCAVGRLRFTSDLRDIEDAGFVWLTLDTPLDEDDRCDLSGLFELFHEFARLTGPHRYIVSSQVPVGTCDRLVAAIPESAGPQIAYVPENLRLGSALDGFRSPDMMVVGADDADYRARVVHLLSRICAEPITCGLRTAEMAKHGINGLLACSISFANELADLAVRVGADAYQVAEIMRRDRRIGRRLPILPGPWFSGGTLARDIRTMQALGAREQAPTPLLDAVMSVNHHRPDRLLDRLAEHVDLRGALVAVLGLVYTEGTDTLRRSPGLQVITALRRRQARVRAFEPMVSADQLSDPSIELCPTALSAATGADAVIVVRPGCAADIDLAALGGVMTGRAVLDFWSALSPDGAGDTEWIHIVPGRAR